MPADRRRTALLVGAVAAIAFAAGVVTGRTTAPKHPAPIVAGPGVTTTVAGSQGTGTGTSTGKTTASTVPPTAAIQTVDGYTWKPVRMGGGGNISGIGAADDGTLIARSDVYGAYLRDPGTSEWRQLFTTDAVPSAWHLPKMGKGVEEVALAPSDSSHVYVMWNGRVYASVDRGLHFTETTFTPAVWDANGTLGRGFGDKMAVDPADPSLVLGAGPDTALRMTVDGGTTWTDTSVPAGQPTSKLTDDYQGVIKSIGITGIAFDRTSGVVNGHTKVAYAASWGNGVFRTEDGGTTWTNIGGPLAVEHAGIDAAGVYYALSGDQRGPFSLQRYVQGAWTEIAPADWNPGGVAGVENPFLAASPAAAGRVVIGYAGQMFATADGGSSWTKLTWKDGQGDVSWATHTSPNYYLVASDLLFDPTNPDRLWLATGEGTQYADLKTGASDLTWLTARKGLENMVATRVASTRNGPPVFGVYDFGQFSGSTNLDDYSLVKGPIPGFSGTTSVAASPFADDYAVAVTTDYVTDSPALNSGYTDDGGATWHRFATMPRGAASAKDFGYGTIAVSTPDNIVWAPGTFNATTTKDFQPYYTTDRGATWKPVVLPGVTRFDQPTIGGPMFGANRQTITADTVKPGVFYLYMIGAGLFRTTDGGATWTAMHQGDFTLGHPDYTDELGALPGKEGTLFYTDGPAGGNDYLGAQKHEGWPLLTSNDGGTTWKPVAGVDKVLAFGFGAPKPGSDVGAIYLAGDVNGQYGIWQSTDGGTVWNHLGDYPYTVDWVTTIGGDMNHFGTVYVGFQGTSYVYGNPQASN